jgi:hypothetical protein
VNAASAPMTANSAAGARREMVRVAGGEADAADRLADAAEPGFGRPGPGLPETGHVHQDDGGIDGRQGGVVQPPLPQRARPEVLDHDVAAGGERPDQLLAFGVAQVQRDRPLVAGDGRPPQALPIDRLPPAAHRVAAFDRLDLDDLGAVVAQQLPGEGPGDQAAHLQHAGARERAGHFGGSRIAPSSRTTSPLT